MVFLSFTPPQQIEPKKKGDEQTVKVASFKVFKGCGSCLGDLQPFKTIVLDEKKGYTIAGGRLYLYDDDVMDGNDYAYRVYPVTVKGTRARRQMRQLYLETAPGTAGPLKVEESDSRVEIEMDKAGGYLYNVYRYDKTVCIRFCRLIPGRSQHLFTWMAV